MFNEITITYIIWVFRELFLYIYTSDDSEEGPPGSIPNPEVKLFSADDTWRATAREDR